MSADQWKIAVVAVLEKAAADAEFRAKCLRDPTGAVREAANFDLPAGTTFVENPEQAGPQAILLPPLGSNADEITDEQLESVAGGMLDPKDPLKTNVVHGTCKP